MGGKAPDLDHKSGGEPGAGSVELPRQAVTLNKGAAAAAVAVAAAHPQTAAEI